MANNNHKLTSLTYKKTFNYMNKEKKGLSFSTTILKRNLDKILNLEAKNIEGLKKKLSDFKKNFIKQIPSDITSLTKQQQQQIIDNYTTILSLQEMKDFLKTSGSVYLNVCLFLLENPMPSVFCKEIHHIFPKFLYSTKQNRKNKLTKNQILVPYNEISVSRDVHMYLHGLRFKEFLDINDKTTIFLSFKNNFDHVNNENLKLTIEDIDRQLSKDNELFNEVQKKQLLINSMGGRAKALKNQEQNKKQLLTQDLTWKNDEYGILPFTINLRNYSNNNETEFIFRDYVIVLIESLPEKCRPKDWNSEKKLKSYVRSISNYLSGKSGTQTTILKYELLNITPAMKKARDEAFINKSHKTTSPQVLGFLKKGNYRWYNTAFLNELPEVKGDYQKFPTIAHLTEFLINLFQKLSYEQREEKDLNSLLYRLNEKKNSKDLSQIRRRFSQVITKIFESAYNWHVEILE